jgi:uncharacterized protein (TIGR03435 family)
MIRCIVCCLLLSAVAYGQRRPQFEVESIRPSSAQVSQVNVGLKISGSQVRISYMSLADYIGMAYSVRPQQIVGPEWIVQERFNIAAKIPDGASSEQVPEMLQTLLANRFLMKMHRETKELPAYVLGIAKDGLKMKESPADPESPADRPGGVTVAATGTGNGVNLDMGGGSSFSFGNNQLQVRKMTMAALADVLTRFVDLPVVDATELKGRYDFTLDFSPEDYTAMMVRSAVNAGLVLPPQALRLLDGASPDTLSGPMQKVGLTMQSRKVPLDVVVIDSMMKAPTDN